MLNIALAEKLIEQITEYTDDTINIMNKDGVIIVSRDSTRIGEFHELAFQLIQSTDKGAVSTHE